MKKWTLLLGIGIGFILGSKSGREPYAMLEARVREVGSRPEVQKAIKTVSKRATDQAGNVVSTVQDKVGEVADKVGDKLPSSAG